MSDPRTAASNTDSTSAQTKKHVAFGSYPLMIKVFNQPRALHDAKIVTPKELGKSIIIMQMTDFSNELKHATEFDIKLTDLKNKINGIQTGGDPAKEMLQKGLSSEAEQLSNSIRQYNKSHQEVVSALEKLQTEKSEVFKKIDEGKSIIESFKMFSDLQAQLNKLEKDREKLQEGQSTLNREFDRVKNKIDQTIHATKVAEANDMVLGLRSSGSGER